MTLRLRNKFTGRIVTFTRRLAEKDEYEVYDDEITELEKAKRRVKNATKAFIEAEKELRNAESAFQALTPSSTLTPTPIPINLEITNETSEVE